ncbi:MAG: ComF family protein [Intrasporangium sp.]|uniref:ComF family protein n=1 Tax=Intrasporangium sp. TaxID=1925024 RepID=UPI003F7E4EFE
MSLRPLLDLVLPLECAACHRTGAPWCRRCGRALERLAFPDGPHLVTPHPPPPGIPPVYAWGTYADPLRAAITAWKDEGRRDLTRQLLPLLDAALTTALADGGYGSAPPLIVPAPSSRRSRRMRGDVPLHELTRLVVAGLPLPGLEVVPVLDERRRVRDQAGLATSARRDNVSGAFRVGPAGRQLVAGRDCLVVDDVMTTGATLVECARALDDAGARHVLGVAVAVPRRRRRRAAVRRIPSGTVGFATPPRHADPTSLPPAVEDG